MAFRNLLASKIKILVVCCAILVTVHVMVFEIPGFYENFNIGSSTLIADVDAFEEILSNTATTKMDNIVLGELNISSFPSMSSKNYSESFLEDLKLASDIPIRPMCNVTPPGLVGPIRVFLDSPSYEQMEKMYPHVFPGGHGKPEDCLARHRVAIIVPYRDREHHLKIFLHNMHAFLKKQQIDYAIFIVEQAANETFNRGKLMNVGYDVASKLYPWQCFIFHDVDLLPEDDRNLYSCPKQPRHMSVAVDKFAYKLPYSGIFGGISALTDEQVRKINGFSNDFWGWGGEDDDLATRTSMAGYKVSRYPGQVARYKMIKHERESTNPVNPCRHKIMGKTSIRYKKDGLSSLHYELLDVDLKKLYTRLHVSLLEKESKKELRLHFPTCH